MPYVARARARGRAGFTLVEVMVAALLGSLLLYTTVNLLLPAMRLSARGSTLVDIDQRAGLLEQRLERALKATSRRGVGVFASGPNRYLSTHPIEGAIAHSKPRLSSSLTVFSWVGEQLTETELPLAHPTLGKPTVLPLEMLLAALPSGRVLHAVEGVTEFQATLEAGPQVSLRFTLEKETEKLAVSRTISLVNN